MPRRRTPSPRDGLSDPVYLRLELADGSTLRAAVDAACGDRFAIENQVYRAAEDFYTYDIDAGALAPAVSFWAATLPIFHSRGTFRFRGKHI